jgi:transposase
MEATALPPLDGLGIDELKALLVQHHAAQSSEIAHLKLVIEKLRHRLFGSKNEKLAAELDQLELDLEERETAQALAAPEIEAPATDSTSRQKPHRKPLPESLPREVITYSPEDACCPGCGGTLEQFGEDVSEQLERIPATFKVIRHVRPKFACARCERVVEAPAPSRPIERGLAGPALLAHVLVAKYGDHQPLYRQSEMYAREGVDLDRSTLAGWVGASSVLFSPLVNALRDHVLAAEKIHADDTPVPVLAPGLGKTKTGRLWTYVRDDRPAADATPPAVWFAYSEDRKGEHPRTHLKSFKGALQADAYAGFHHLYGDGSIYEVACWAHARRKFHEIHVLHASPTTTEVLNRIGALYAIEEEVRGKPAELRHEVRQSRAKPQLDDLRTWMEKSLRQLSPKSETAAAIRYALSRWKALTRYAEDGRLEIDNNSAERALRTVALGRKNFLFAGSDSGGERAAAMYSLIGSAKLNGLDPELYLRSVLARIATHTISRIAELLPWNLAENLTGASIAA